MLRKDSISESAVTGPIWAACSLQSTLRLRHGLIKHALMDQKFSDPLLQPIVSTVHALSQPTSRAFIYRLQAKAKRPVTLTYETNSAQPQPHSN